MGLLNSRLNKIQYNMYKISPESRCDISESPTEDKILVHHYNHHIQKNEPHTFIDNNDKSSQ